MFRGDAMSIVGTRTITARAVFRVRGGYELHERVTVHVLHATKGWRRDGRSCRKFWDYRSGRKPGNWNAGTTIEWRA